MGWSAKDQNSQHGLTTELAFERGQLRLLLKEIFGGKEEGFLSDLWGAIISEWLPTQTGKTEIGWDGKPSVTVDGIGQATLKPLKDGTGKPTDISGAVSST